MSDMETPTKTAIRLARAFSDVLQRHLDEIGEGSIREIIERNKCEPDSGVCHSHDFCDANMAMLEAFESEFKRKPALLSETATAAERESDAAMWSAAWDIAKAAEFFI